MASGLRPWKRSLVFVEALEILAKICWKIWKFGGNDKSQEKMWKIDKVEEVAVWGSSYLLKLSAPLQPTRGEASVSRSAYWPVVLMNRWRSRTECGKCERSRTPSAGNGPHCPTPDGRYHAWVPCAYSFALALALAPTLKGAIVPARANTSPSPNPKPCSRASRSIALLVPRFVYMGNAFVTLVWLIYWFSSQSVVWGRPCN